MGLDHACGLSPHPIPSSQFPRSLFLISLTPNLFFLLVLHFLRMLRGYLRPYVTRTTLIPNTQAAPCLSARTFMLLAFRSIPHTDMVDIYSLPLPPFLFIHPILQSSESCSGDNCATECSGDSCGRTLPAPPLFQTRNPPPVCLLAHFHVTCFSFNTTNRHG